MNKAIFQKHGYGDRLGHRTGYSIGINYAPDWGEGHIMSIWDGDERPLRPGMTFHLVPGLPSTSAATRSPSATRVLVTENGCEVADALPTRAVRSVGRHHSLASPAVRRPRARGPHTVTGVVDEVGAHDISPAWCAQLAPSGRLLVPLQARAARDRVHTGQGTGFLGGHVERREPPTNRKVRGHCTLDCAACAI